MSFPLVVGVLLGLSVSSFISLTSIVLVDLLGLDSLTSAFGLLVSFRGVSSVLGPPAAGALLDATGGDFATVFRAAGATFVAGALCGQTAYLIQRSRIKKFKTDNNNVKSGKRNNSNTIGR